MHFLIIKILYFCKIELIIIKKILIKSFIFYLLNLLFLMIIIIQYFKDLLDQILIKY